MIGGTLTAVISTDPGNLDPQGSVIDTAVQLAMYGYDTLVGASSTGAPEAQLATSWQMNSAGDTYTFVIRKGVTCSDGSAMTPQVIAENLDYVGNPKNESPLTGVAIPVGLTATADSAASTVTAHLSSPAPFFLNSLSLMPIVCQKGLSNRAILAHATDGSGPFVLTQAVSGDHYTYTVRKGYDWGPGGASTSVAGMPATIVFKVVANETTAANLLLDGGANVATVVGADRSRLSAAGLFHTDTLAPIGQMYFNEASGEPGADPVVRRALTMALNLPQVGAVLSGGDGVAPQRLVTAHPQPCAGSTVPGNVPGYNLSQAEALLNQDGWTVGPGGVREKNGKKLAISLLYASDEGDGAAAAELGQQEWQQLGLQTTLDGQPSTQAGNVLFGTGAWDVAWIGIGVGNPAQLVSFLSGPVPPTGTNFAHLDNTGYDSLVAQASTHPGSSGCAQWDAAEKSLFQAVDVVPFEDTVAPVWGSSATFESQNGDVVPTSLRLLG